MTDLLRLTFTPNPSPDEATIPAIENGLDEYNRGSAG
jgi:hypothetical protein